MSSKRSYKMRAKQTVWRAMGRERNKTFSDFQKVLDQTLPEALLFLNPSVVSPYIFLII